MPLMQPVAGGVKGPVLLAVVVLCAWLLGSLFYIAHADTANLTLRLTIISPPQCTFNSGSGTTMVSFGEVQQGLIDGVSYKRMPIDTGLSCIGLEKNALNMGLSWNELTLNGVSSVRTNRTNLGIAIYRDSTRLSNNSTINFNYGASPSLYAVPVKPFGTMLTDAGAFTGTMTLTLNYQ